ncbi:MAG TPA: molybdenum cofactor biosynthesis protein MoaE [Conexibacter sp.]|nr:molybdenum cofactor biosynthesis protein MoaE [Conexibacter sp.]
MQISVRVFAMLRELLGADRLELELPDGSSVADLLASLPEPARGLPLVVAVNRGYAKPETVLHAADEVALVPPVSGGAEPRVHVLLTDAPLSVDDALARVRDPAAGAAVVFMGVTREVDKLDYEAYAEMAEQVMREIAEAVAREHALCAIAISHRVGAVPLSEPSVVVAASSPHRPEAFAGARGDRRGQGAGADLEARDGGGRPSLGAGEPPDARRLSAASCCGVSTSSTAASSHATSITPGRASSPRAPASPRSAATSG